MKTLFTIGYEGTKPSDLFVSLKESGVSLLIDVRDVPLSRKPGFSKTSLAQGLEEAGMQYLHLKGSLTKGASQGERAAPTLAPSDYRHLVMKQPLDRLLQRLSAIRRAVFALRL